MTKCTSVARDPDLIGVSMCVLHSLCVCVPFIMYSCNLKLWHVILFVYVYMGFFIAVCPKWAKLRKNHKEKKSLVMLVICSSALRSLELIKYVDSKCYVEVGSQSEVLSWNHRHRGKTGPLSSASQQIH